MTFSRWLLRTGTGGLGPGLWLEAYPARATHARPNSSSSCPRCWGGMLILTGNSLI
jgi:hypothetical protein